MTIPRRKPYFPKNIIIKVFRFVTNKKNVNEIEKLEKALTSRLGIPNPIVVSSGRIGLYLILKASKLPKGCEVLIPGYTFGLLKKFIIKAGYKPIAVDIDINTFQMSPKSIQEKITSNTGAILATHLFGQPCDIKTILKISRKNNVLLIEDCAESLGAKVNGKLTGTFGDISLSSFNIAKPLQGITGGLIFGKNKIIISRIKSEIKKIDSGFDATKNDIVRSLVGHFLSQTFFWPILMYIFSYDIFRNILVTSYRSHDNTKVASANLPYYLAYITNLNLINFKKRLIDRMKIRELYVKYLASYVDFQKTYPKSFGSNYMIVAKVNTDTLKLRRYLAIRGIDIAIMDEVADNCTDNKYSNVSKIHNNLVALPVYESLTKNNIRFICNTIINYLSTH